MQMGRALKPAGPTKLITEPNIKEKNKRITLCRHIYSSLSLCMTKIKGIIVSLLCRCGSTQILAGSPVHVKYNKTRSIAFLALRSCPILSWPFLSCPVQSCLVLSCLLSFPALSSPALSSPFLSAKRNQN